MAKKRSAPKKWYVISKDGHLLVADGRLGFRLLHYTQFVEEKGAVDGVVLSGRDVSLVLRDLWKMVLHSKGDWKKALDKISAMATKVGYYLVRLGSDVSSWPEDPFLDEKTRVYTITVNEKKILATSEDEKVKGSYGIIPQSTLFS